MFGSLCTLQAALVLGGVDSTGQAHLYSIQPHGSSDKGMYTALGSGSLSAMSVLESGMVCPNRYIHCKITIPWHCFVE
jgi:20S proteasome alpha/beta subunit